MMENARPAPVREPGRFSDAVISALVGVAVGLILLVLRPVAGMPMNDDFSYARTAEAFAKTGHVVYNGWGSPILFPQMLIGALLIRLFGFSYYLTQYFGITIAALTGATLYQLARWSTLSRPLSLLICTLACINPIYLGLAPTFMTDIPSLLLLLLMLLALVRSIRPAQAQKTPDTDRVGVAPVTRVDARWLIAAIVLGLIAGSNRQIDWVASLGALLVVTFLVPGARKLGLLGCVLHLVAAGIGTLWFDSQPYSIPSSLGVKSTYNLLMGFPTVFAMLLYHMGFMIGLFLFPFSVSALLLQIAAKRPVRWLLFFGVALFCLLPIVHPLEKSPVLALMGEHYHLTTLPYGQYFTHVGIIVGTVFGWQLLPPVLTPTMIHALIIVGSVGMACSGYLLFSWLDDLREIRSAQGGGWTSGQIAATALGAASVVQILASIPWFAVLNMFDRYLVLQVPGLLFLHAFHLQTSWSAYRAADPDRQPLLRRRILPLLAAVTLSVPVVVIGTLGLAYAADYFGVTRARAALYRRVLARGISPAEIHAGFEPASDYQVVQAGYMNNDHIKIPAGAYKAVPKDMIDPQDTIFTTLHAKYLMSYMDPDHMPAQLVTGTPIDSESYATPLPPGRRTLYVYRLSDLAAIP